MPAKTVNDIVALCKRRGFIFTGSEIYGGLGGAYDYGPYGVELMKNIKNAWWNAMIYSRNDIEGLDAALISNRLMWKYSGHEGSFSDPLVECKKCGARMRQDKMKDPTKCDNCGPRAGSCSVCVNSNRQKCNTSSIQKMMKSTLKCGSKFVWLGG